MTTDELLTVRALAHEAEKKWQEARSERELFQQKEKAAWNHLLQLEKQLAQAFGVWKANS